MDETAEAIARLREEAKADKAEKPGRGATAGLKPRPDQAEAGAGNRKAGQVAPPSATRRRKTGGG